MDNQNEPDFTFGDDDSKNSYTEDVDSKKIDKLTQKVTLLSILIPCILGLLLVFLYFDMTNKVGKVDSSGSAKVLNISKELEKTITDIKEKSDAVEKSLGAKIDKTLVDINNRMKKAEKNISFLTYAKMNKKQTAADLKKVNDSVTKLQENLTAVSNSTAELVSIAEVLKQRSGEIEPVKQSVKLLREDFEKTNNSYITQEELDDNLKKQKRLFQLEIKDSYNKLTKKIALLKFANQTDTPKKKVVEPNSN